MCSLIWLKNLYLLRRLAEPIIQRLALKKKLRTSVVTRKEMRDAVTQLSASGRIVEKDLPKEHRQGGRKTYLSVLEDPAEYGGIEQKYQTTPPENSDPTTPPPYRERFGGGVAPPKSSPFPQPCRDVSAGFGGVGGVEPESDERWAEEVDI